MLDESFEIRRQIGPERSDYGREYAPNALSHGSFLIKHPGSSV